MSFLVGLVGSLFSSGLGMLQSGLSTAASAKLTAAQLKLATASADMSIAKAKESQYGYTVLANSELYYNTQRLKDAFLDNVALNYENSAKAMSKLTSDYIEADGKVVLNFAAQEGLSFNSARDDTRNKLQNTYAESLVNVTRERNWNEEQMIEQYDSETKQQELNWMKTIYGINTAYESAELAAEQQKLNAQANATYQTYQNYFGQNSTLGLNSLFSTVSSGVNYISNILKGNYNPYTQYTTYRGGTH